MSQSERRRRQESPAPSERKTAAGDGAAPAAARGAGRFQDPDLLQAPGDGAAHRVLVLEAGRFFRPARRGYFSERRTAVAERCSLAPKWPCPTAAWTAWRSASTAVPGVPENQDHPNSQPAPRPSTS